MTEPETPTAEQRIALLQTELKESQNKTIELISLVSYLAKARILGDPLVEFFSAPEAWDVYYPDDNRTPFPPPSPCVKDCVKVMHEEATQCFGIADEAERKACMGSMMRRYRTCLRECRTGGGLAPD